MVGQKRAAIPYSSSDLTLDTAFDSEQDRYLLMVIGRENNKRVHSCLSQIDFINGNLWVHYGGTETGVAKELLARGGAREHIVLAFKAPEMCQYSEFAVV